MSSVSLALRFSATILLSTSLRISSSSILSSALACLSERPACNIQSCSSIVSLRSLSLFATVDCFLPRRIAASSCVSPYFLIRRLIPLASSNILRSARWIFSRRANIADSLSVHLIRTQGTFVSPASTAARNLRSPATSSYSVWLSFLTVKGCNIPFVEIDWDKSLSSSSSKDFLGWVLLGRICIVGISRTLFSSFERNFILSPHTPV